MMPHTDIDLVRKNFNFRRKAIFSVSDHLEKHGPGLFDVSELSFDKDVILHAYLIEIATNPSKSEIEVFAAGALLLANFQPGVVMSSFSKADISGLLSMPLFEGEEIFETDKKAMAEQLAFMEVFKSSSRERGDILDQIQNAKYLNSAIQPLFEKIRRSAWRIIRPCLQALLFAAILIVVLPLLVLPIERRKELLRGPSNWINWLSERPRYSTPIYSTIIRLNRRRMKSSLKL